jgi:trk system potassium uptake protein
MYESVVEGLREVAPAAEAAGVHGVVYPERETGTRVAHSLLMPLVVTDYFDVGPGYGLAKIRSEKMTGKTLEELDLRGKYGVTPLFLRRRDKVLMNPHREERLQSGDEITVAGRDEQLEKLDF